MAEGRMLKRNISDSRRLSELKTDSARLLWTWIIPYLDVEGRYFASPDMIKGKVVPRLKTFTESKISEYLEDMNRVGLITIYAVDGDKYLQFRKFDDFQTLRKDREGKPLPGPENGNQLQYNSGSTPGELHPNLREVNIREDKIRHLDAVLLTNSELDKLKSEHGEQLTNKAIELLNAYLMSSGKKYKSHYHTLIGWPLKKAKEDGGGSKWFNSNS